jgi:2-iminoacetate synthase
MKPETYLELFNQSNWEDVSRLIEHIAPQDVELALHNKGAGGLQDFAALISPIASKNYLEEMAILSNRLTEQRFGKAIRLFAPLYLSNECNNVCDYCGFSLGNKIPRKTLTPVEIIKEAGSLRKKGFEHILLVTGESAQVVDISYLKDALTILNPYFSNLSIEVQPLKQNEYEILIENGLHSVFVYQETYNRESYAKHHLKGKKRNFDWRIQTTDRLGCAKIKKIGLGCLYGLTKDWRTDAYFAAHHLSYLEKRYWQTSYSMSFPRLRPCKGETDPATVLEDRDLVQLLCAFRILSHELELSISTRESATLRENLLPLGVTTLSAGSKTNPGGYAVEEKSLEQFEISDDRSPKEIFDLLQNKGYDPVWKDWDHAYNLTERGNNPLSRKEKVIRTTVLT